MRLALGTTAVGLLPCLGALPGQGPSGDVLHPIQGEAIRGRVVEIKADGEVLLTLPDDVRATRSLATLREIVLARRSGAPVPRQGFVQLRSGVRLPATTRECAARRITLDSPLSEGQSTFSLSHIQAIRFTKLEAQKDGGFKKYLAAPKEDDDLIYVRTPAGKILQRSVTIEGFVDEAIHYQVRGKTRSRKIADLYGIIMARGSGFAPDPLPRPRVILGMRGGTSIRGELEKMDGQYCVLSLAEKVTLKVLRRRVEKITVESDRLVYLTDLQPTGVEQTPAFRTKKPWMINRTPLGAGIRLGGVNPRTVENGVVLIPRTRLSYDIGGAFDFFQATICIDNRSTGPAHAIFRVKSGDKVLYESKPVTLRSEPVAIKVPVATVKTLTIEADFGRNFDFGDHCVFAEARVIKQGP